MRHNFGLVVIKFSKYLSNRNRDTYVYKTPENLETNGCEEKITAEKVKLRL
jgi:hypothetical protein